MKINLTKNNGRFGFDVTEDSGRVVYSSNRHYFLVPSQKSSYQYAWEACRDGWKMAYQTPYHIDILKNAAISDMGDDDVREDVSAEDMLVTHYLGALRDIRRRVKGATGDPKEKENAWQELKLALKEVETIKEQMTDRNSQKIMEHLISKFNKIKNKYFKAEAAKELSEVNAQPPDMGMSAPMPPAGAPAMPPSGAPPMPMGSTKNNIKISSIVDSESEDANEMGDDLKRDIIEDIAQKVCLSIQKKHNDAYYVIDVADSIIRILNFDNEPVLKIKVNDSFNVSSIVPAGGLNKIHPLHSVEFYQKYWKPIVESVGHFSFGEPPVLIANNPALPCLPNAPREIPSVFVIEGWNVKEKQPQHINVSFRGKDKPIWLVERNVNMKTAAVHSTSKYTEQEYLNAIVKCVDPQLTTIFGKTGAVIQIVPLTDTIELDIDFGKGMDVVRLTEKQIEKVL